MERGYRKVLAGGRRGGRSLFEAGVNDDGYGAVVSEAHGHVGAEDALFYHGLMPGGGVFGAVGFGGTEQGGEVVAVVPVEGACFVATGGADVGGTVAAARGGGEGELAYGEHAAADSCYG